MRVSVFLVIVGVYLLFINLIPISWAIDLNDRWVRTTLPTAVRVIDPDVLIPLVVLPLSAIAGLALSVVSGRVNNSLGFFAGTLPVFFFCVTCLCAWLGILTSRDSHHIALLAAFGMQLLAMPAGLILFAQAIYRPRYHLQSLRYSPSDALLAITTVGLILGVTKLFSQTWTGYSLEIARAVTIANGLMLFLLVVDLRWKRLLARLLESPKSIAASYLTIMLFLAASAGIAAHWHANEFGALELRLINLPNRPVTTIQDRYTRDSFSMRSKEFQRLRLRNGEYRIIVTEPGDPKVVNEAFKIEGGTILRLRFDCARN